MSTYEVINVGQGDCILINPPSGCTFGEEKLFVDLGPGNVDVTKCVADDQEISIFLTHHHDDHIGGLKLFASTFNRIKNIYLPLYQNETTLIADALLHMKALRSSPGCEDFINELKGIVGDQIFIKHLGLSGGNNKIKFVYEGCILCNHIQCLNPPATISTRRYDRDEMIELARELFEPEFADFFVSYIHSDGDARNYLSNNRIDRDYRREDIDSNPYWISGSNERYYQFDEAGVAYVMTFFIDNIIELRSLNASSSTEAIRKIRESFHSYTHDVCMVLRTTFNKQSMLMTGDASIKVFKRLLKKKQKISAKYLKLSHHGSKGNYDRNIIDAIHPEVIIISHNNGLFGRATDPHPNKEVIEDLENDFHILLTNDVVKNGIKIMQRKDHEDDPYRQVKIRDV